MIGTTGNCDTSGGQPAPSVNAGTLQLLLTATTVTGSMGAAVDNARTATFTKTGYFGVTASTSTAQNGRSGISIAAIRVVSCSP